MQTKNKGFTLIELMIVVAIVAILAAVAIPAYQDYLTRSKVAEVAAAAGACKTSVSEYYASEGSMPADANTAGCSQTATEYVSGLAISGNAIEVTAQNAGPFTGNKIILTADIVSSEITKWNCTTDGAKKYVPASCR